MKLNQTEKEQLRKLFTNNGLSKDDIFVHKNFTIIKRAGIEKIQFKNQIKVEFDIIKCEPEFVVMKALAFRTDQDGDDYSIETFGSATPQNCMSKHLVEMAEKRALSRAILKVTNMYEHGVFGEDEDVHRS